MSKLGGQQSYALEGFQPLITEEPYAGIPHVRICEGPGWVTAGSTRKQVFGNWVDGLLADAIIRQGDELERLNRDVSPNLKYS